MIDSAEVAEQAVPPPPVQRVPWWTLAWFLGLLAALYLPVLVRMVQEWGTEEEMSHGFFVPFVVGYIVWQRRDQLAAVPVRPHWSGYVLLVLGFMQLVVGQLGADFFIMRTAFLVSFLGVLLAVQGVAFVKELLLPLCLLLFMIRIPQLIYGQITLPLQLFASSVAETILTWIGIPVLREGNILELPSQRLSVVEACSGIRSLLSLLFLSLVYGYLFEAKLWLRAVLFAATIPIAIGANALRVTITGILSEFNKELSEGIYHSLEGYVIFLIALVALGLTHTLANKIWAMSHRGKAAQQ